MSPKTDEIMGNSGTATAVPAVPGAAPLFGSDPLHLCHTLSSFWLPSSLLRRIAYFLDDHKAVTLQVSSQAVIRKERAAYYIGVH